MCSKVGENSSYCSWTRVGVCVLGVAAVTTFAVGILSLSGVQLFKLDQLSTGAKIGITAAGGSTLVMLAGGTIYFCTRPFIKAVVIDKYNYQAVEECAMNPLIAAHVTDLLKPGQMMFHRVDPLDVDSLTLSAKTPQGMVICHPFRKESGRGYKLESTITPTATPSDVLNGYPNYTLISLK